MGLRYVIPRLSRCQRPVRGLYSLMLNVESMSWVCAWVRILELAVAPEIYSWEILDLLWSSLLLCILLQVDANCGRCYKNLQTHSIATRQERNGDTVARVYSSSIFLVWCTGWRSYVFVLGLIFRLDWQWALCKHVWATSALNLVWARKFAILQVEQSAWPRSTV